MMGQSGAVAVCSWTETTIPRNIFCPDPMNLELTSMFPTFPWGKGLPGGGGGSPASGSFYSFEERSCKDISVSWVNVRLRRMAPGICKSISTACSMIWSQFYLAGMLWNFFSPCKMTFKNRDGTHFHFFFVCFCIHCSPKE